MFASSASHQTVSVGAYCATFASATPADPYPSAKVELGKSAAPAASAQKAPTCVIELDMIDPLTPAICGPSRQHLLPRHQSQRSHRRNRPKHNKHGEN